MFFYLQSRFFHNFPFYALFQRFARFEKAGYQPVERAAEVACMHQQYFFAFPYQHE